jgi:hypothetical protein
MKVTAETESPSCFGKCGYGLCYRWAAPPPPPEGSDDTSHRASQLHHAARRRGSVAARGAGAAGGDAGGGVSQSRIARWMPAHGECILSGPARILVMSRVRLKRGAGEQQFSQLPPRLRARAALSIKPCGLKSASGGCHTIAGRLLSGCIGFRLTLQSWHRERATRAAEQ